MRYKFNIVTIISASIGLVDSIYLTWVKLSNNTATCLPGIGDCETVNTSRFSAINGVPIALLGSLAFLVMLTVELLGGYNSVIRSNRAYILFGISLIGTLYSAYLTYVEIAILQAICPFCVISAICITVILADTVVRLFWKSGQPKILAWRE